MTIWRLVVLAILVLVLRRLPIIMAVYKFIPPIRNWREAVFTGWFGPIGVGALFYYTVALESIPEDGPHAHARKVLQPVVYFMVLASIIAHGITIPLFYSGKYATRTLTRTSSTGNPVLHIPKFHRKNDPSIDESDITDVGVKKFTAITIVTPDELARRQSLDVLDYLPDDTPSNKS